MSTAAPLVAPEFLALSHIGAAAAVNTDDAGINPIVEVCPHPQRQIAGQKPHLARRRAIRRHVNCKHILYLSLVTINHMLLYEANLTPGLKLQPTAGVVGAATPPVIGGGTNNIHHNVGEVQDDGCT